MLTPARDDMAVSNDSKETETETERLAIAVESSPGPEAPTWKSLSKDIFTNIKRTIPTALASDFSVNLPILVAFLSNRGYAAAAPSITSFMVFTGFTQFGILLPASYKLSKLFGNINELERQKEVLLLEGHLDALPSIHQLDQKIQKNRFKLSKTPRNAFLVSLLSIPPTMTIMILIKKILQSFRQDEDIANHAESFFHPLYWPFFQLGLCRLTAELIIFSNKQAIPAMGIAMVCLLATISLEYALGFKTSLDIEGFGLGAGIGILLTCIGFVGYVAKYYKPYQFFNNLLHWNNTDKKYCKWHLWQAFLILASGTSDIAVPLAISLMAGSLSKNAILIQANATALANIMNVITSATSQTTSVAVADALGTAKANKIHFPLIKRAATAGLISTVILQLPMVVFALGDTALFMKAFGSEADQSAVQNLLFVTAFYGIIDSLRCILLASFRSIDSNPTTPSMISSFTLLLGILLAFVLSNYTSMGVMGLPTGLVISGLIGSSIMLYRFQHWFTPENLLLEPKGEENIEEVPALAQGQIARLPSPINEEDNDNAFRV